MQADATEDLILDFVKSCDVFERSNFQETLLWSLVILSKKG